MEKVNIPGWGEPQIVRESQGVRVGVRDGFWTEGEASDSERVVKTLLLSTTYAHHVHEWERLRGLWGEEKDGTGEEEIFVADLENVQSEI